MKRLGLILAALWLGACAGQQPHRVPSEKLYFSVELRHEGKVVGTPKLLGESGKVIRVERRRPGAVSADYSLVLSPTLRLADEDAFQVGLEVAVPRAIGHSNLRLLHGEERRIQLGDHPGDLEITLVLMRVDSPEFRALMDLSTVDDRRASAI